MTWALVFCNFQSAVVLFTYHSDFCWNLKNVSDLILMVANLCWYLFGCYQKTKLHNQEHENHTSHKNVKNDFSSFGTTFTCNSPFSLPHSITAAFSHLLLLRWSLKEDLRPTPACLRRTRTSRPLRLPSSHREPPRNQAATCWHPTLPSSTDPPTAPSRNLHLTPAEPSYKHMRQ